MLLFVAAAAIALLFGPTRKPPPAVPAVAPSPVAVQEVVDPWRTQRTDLGVTAPAVATAARPADDVVDPWARPAAPPPGAVTVVDAPVDPWAAPVADAAAPSADRDGLLDPWNRGHDPHASTSPHVLGRKDPNRPAQLRDPWEKREEPSAGANATKPKVNLPPRLPAPSGVRDPWRQRDADADATRPTTDQAAPPPAAKADRAPSSKRPRAEVADPWK